jgi:ParB/RepB/Spo0J family partition protein
MNNNTLQSVPLGKFVLSQTSLQKARRADRSKDDIREMADSIKAAGGIIEPVIARPHKGDKVEMVAGEGRYLGAESAGLTEIPTIVRELTDEQVEVIQLIENLRRKGLHELVEAEGYDMLIKRGHGAEEIVAKTGASSKAYVYARLKLLALCQDARKAFREGTISASIALLIARIPLDNLQCQALKEVTKPRYGGEPLSYRQAVEHIRENYMLRLDEAPFDVTADNLVRGAVPCARCPKNTIAQLDVFGDVKGASAGVCTDPTCFKSKAKRAMEIKLEQAKAAGQTVIEGKKAKEIFPYGTHDARGGYAKLDGSVWTGDKHVKVTSLLPKNFKPTLVKIKDDHEGGEKVIEVVPDSAVRQAMKDKGVSTRSVQTDSGAAHRRAEDKKHKREVAFRRELFKAVMAKVPQRLERKDLETVALAFLEDIWHDTRVKVVAAWGWVAQDGKVKLTPDEIAARELPKVTEAELARFLFGLTIAKDLNVSSYSSEKPKGLLAAAQRFKVNADAIRKDLIAAEKAKADKKAPAQASKKKAAKKPK